MITGELRGKIDRVWEAFWTGGLSNPITVIEQMTYLLFIRRLDELHTQREQKAAFLKKPIELPIYREDQYELRWSYFKNQDPEVMHELFRKQDGVFDFMKSYAEEGSAFHRFMKGAVFMIPTPRLLGQVVDMLEGIDMTDRDTKGDVYEYLLSKIASAGQNGQFRTPRHIIQMMVEMVAPTTEDVICDPSAGSSGFLVYSGEYIRQQYANELLKPPVQKHFQEKMFMGMEFDPTMIRIGAMNLILHGVENPNLKDVDALSEANTSFTEQATIVLANPPFKGSLDREAVDPKILNVVDSKKTELLFLALILKGLKVGGRAAVIVPDGVLFGSSKAHLQIRKELVDKQKLQAVISMPSGVFKPYAGVSTAVLLFTRTDSGGTDKVWFYDMEADGFSLDDKRTPQADKNDIPDIVARWKALVKEVDRKRTDKSFFVPLKEIHENNYDLSINRYKEVVYEQKQYDKPDVIIRQIEKLDGERKALLEELKEMLLEGETLPMAAEEEAVYEPAKKTTIRSTTTDLTTTAKSSTGKDELLIEALRQLDSEKWITQYFDLVNKLLADLGVDGDDPRLAMTISGKTLPVNLGQRYILKPYADQQLGIIVPEWFDEESVNGEVNFWFSRNEEVDAKWIIIDYPLGKTLPRALYNACVEACADIMNRSKKSGFRKSHVPLLYEFTTETSVRNEIIGELKAVTV